MMLGHFGSHITEWLGSCKKKNIQDGGPSRSATVAVRTLVTVKQYASE